MIDSTPNRRSGGSIRLYIAFEGIVVPGLSMKGFLSAFAESSIEGTSSRSSDGVNPSAIQTDAVQHRGDERLGRLWRPADSFGELVEWTRVHAIPLTILSEFPLQYVRNMLAQVLRQADAIRANPSGDTHGGREAPSLDSPDSAGVQVFGNDVVLREGECPVVVYPWADAECTRCRNCFRNHLVTRSGDQDCIVFIGADALHACPASFADIVFATAELETRCREENISFHTFTSFGDVCRRLFPLLNRSRHHHPRHAESQRRGLWMSG